MITPGFELLARDKQQEERSLLPLKLRSGMSENRVQESKGLKTMNREGPPSAPAESPDGPATRG